MRKAIFLNFLFVVFRFPFSLAAYFAILCEYVQSVERIFFFFSTFVHCTRFVNDEKSGVVGSFSSCGLRFFFSIILLLLFVHLFIFVMCLSLIIGDSVEVNEKLHKRWCVRVQMCFYHSIRRGCRKSASNH